MLGTTLEEISLPRFSLSLLCVNFLKEHMTCVTHCVEDQQICTILLCTQQNFAIGEEGFCHALLKEQIPTLETWASSKI